METPVHIIKELRIDVEIQGKIATLNMGEEVAEFCKAQFIPAIAQQLDGLAHSCDGELDTLTIVIGPIGSAAWKQEVKEKFNGLVKERFEAISQTYAKKETIFGGAAGASTSKMLEEALQRQLNRFHGKDEGVDIEEGHTLQVEKISEAYIYFLERGCLPWWYPTDSSPDIHKVYAKTMTRKPALRLWSILRERSNARKRFLTQMPGNGLSIFFKLVGISEKLLKDHSTLYTIFTNTIAPQLPKNDFQSTFHEALIIAHDPLIANLGRPEQRFLKELLALLKLPSETGSGPSKGASPGWHDFTSQIKAVWPHLSSRQAYFDGLLQKQGRATRTSQESEVHGKDETTDPKTTDGLGRIPENGIHERSEHQPEPIASKQEPLFETELREGVYVNYAGVVLLHPFLPALFEKLGLLKAGAWKNRQSQLKGVHVLAYLVGGSRCCPEQDQLLFKHLCGLSWETIVAPSLDLEPYEMEEADALLRSVLDHWTALKGTSPDGLREGFIRRTGKLIKKQDSWLLYVEQKSQDILLQQLPWGIGMLRFPWMKELIWINWN